MARLCLDFTTVVFTLRQVEEFVLVNARGRVEREKDFRASVSQSEILFKLIIAFLKAIQGRISAVDFEMNN